MKEKPKAKLCPRFRLMRGADIALGPGKVELLEELALTGSLTRAAQKMGLSYMRAWQLVQMMNRCFREPLVALERGGKRGGGAHLTKAGGTVVRLYRRLESQTAQATRPVAAQLCQRLR
jgi:molybdate transport system regulatory protein